MSKTSMAAIAVAAAMLFSAICVRLFSLQLQNSTGLYFLLGAGAGLIVSVVAALNAGATISVASPWGVWAAVSSIFIGAFAAALLDFQKAMPTELSFRGVFLAAAMLCFVVWGWVHLLHARAATLSEVSALKAALAFAACALVATFVL